MTDFDLDAYIAAWRPRIDAGLIEILDRIERCDGCPEDLMAAMRYALLSGGKRLRPLLVLAAAEACGGDPDALVTLACSLEFVHAYSLIHDDLPAMDDDDFRRGKPTCHKAFGEALAILAGDALLTQAFSVLVEGFSVLAEPRIEEGVEVLASAAGCYGMVGGQADDVRPLPASPAEQSIDPVLVESIHMRKTARLMQAALDLGALAVSADSHSRAALKRYGACLGLAFQVADDLLAFSGEEGVLGRPTNSDRDNSRRTFPLAVGESKSRTRAEQLLVDALAAIEPLGRKADALRSLAGLVRHRVDQGQKKG